MVLSIGPAGHGEMSCSGVIGAAILKGIFEVAMKPLHYTTGHWMVGCGDRMVDVEQLNCFALMEEVDSAPYQK